MGPVSGTGAPYSIKTRYECCGLEVPGHRICACPRCLSVDVVTITAIPVKLKPKSIKLSTQVVFGKKVYREAS